MPALRRPARRIRALSVTQPWASLIAVGAKHVETRTWGTAYRGLLAIHATKGLPANWEALSCDPVFYRALAPHFRDGPLGGVHGLPGPAELRQQLPRGAVVAIAELVDVRRITTPDALGDTIGDGEVAFGDYTSGRYAWVLANVQPLPEPIPARGAQGLWWWDAPADLALAGGAR